mgnify:CR=1 FL=1
MIIYPAIDMKDQACVRLIQGDYDRMTVYESDPIKVAKRWEAEGASILHLVDLDGARDGLRVNEAIVKKIIENIFIPVQLGGGIRDSRTIEKFLGYGVGQVIIGTGAIKNREWMKEVINTYGDRVVLSIDAMKGYLATDGWKKVSDVKALDLILELEQFGLKRIVYTDIEKDGMLRGPNFEIYEDLARQSPIEIIASGGITTLEDVRRLKDMGIYGAIIGKALYNGDLDLKEVLKCQ